ncbi:haloacid dehalogenase type II [Mesorhizobium atlanticum]
MRRHAGEIEPDGQLLSEIWRAKQLEYSWVRTLMGSYADFWQLTEQALEFALRKVPSADPALRTKLLEAYWRLDCYPEVPAVLKALKSSGAKLAILSNGSPGDARRRGQIRRARPDPRQRVFGRWVKRFKTDPVVYDMVVTSWRLYPGAVSFQSSNRWDIAGATKFGFRTVWINRTNQPDEYRDFPPGLILPSLDGLLASV